MDLLLSKGVVDSHSVHKVSHSFPKVVRSDEFPSPLELPLLTILSQQSRWEDIHSEWFRVDTGAQPVIFRVQFAKKMGMLNSKLQKSMWQIHTASGSVEEVFKESSNSIAFNFNEGIDQELCLQVRCLVTNATNYNVFIGQEALFSPGFIIDN